VLVVLLRLIVLLRAQADFVFVPLIAFASSYLFFLLKESKKIDGPNLVSWRLNVVSFVYGNLGDEAPRFLNVH
jgi:hypothetical protein